jgi:hypothetical protein
LDILHTRYLDLGSKGFAAATSAVQHASDDDCDSESVLLLLLPSSSSDPLSEVQLASSLHDDKMVLLVRLVSPV